MEQKNVMMIPYIEHEGIMAREERKQKRLWIALIMELLLALFAISKL